MVYPEPEAPGKFIAGFNLNNNGWSVFMPTTSMRRPQLTTSLIRCLLTAGLTASFAADAIDADLQVGVHYTDLRVNMGMDSPGMYMQGTWAHNNNQGERAGLGIGLGLPLGDLMISGGGKALYLNPKMNLRAGHSLLAVVSHGLCHSVRPCLLKAITLRILCLVALIITANLMSGFAELS
ncbi:YfaZ family outer membrane protein [Enterobacter mori]|nr:YfaZ family outer membrane protein [Enterobacter mori]